MSWRKKIVFTIITVSARIRIEHELPTEANVPVGCWGVVEALSCLGTGSIFGRLSIVPCSPVCYVWHDKWGHLLKQDVRAFKATAGRGGWVRLRDMMSINWASDLNYVVLDNSSFKLLMHSTRDVSHNTPAWDRSGSGIASSPHRAVWWVSLRVHIQVSIRSTEGGNETTLHCHALNTE